MELTTARVNGEEVVRSDVDIVESCRSEERNRVIRGIMTVHNEANKQWQPK